MEDIRRFLHTLYGLFEKGTRIRGILGCFLGGLFLNIVIELMDRKSFSAVFVLLESHPLAFLENVLILTFSLSLCLFSKRRWFFGILIGMRQCRDCGCVWNFSQNSAPMSIFRHG